MDKEYCVNIDFPNIDFDVYIDGRENCPKTFHGHFIPKDGEIELQLFFSANSFFEHKFSKWLKTISWRDFGKYFKVELLSKDRIKKIHFDEASILTFSSSSNIHKTLGKWISIKLDYVKTYLPPNKENIGTAEFYLNDNGFKFVSDFHAVMWPTEANQFTFSKMNYVLDKYKLGEIQFSPQFNLIHSDSRDKQVATITKEPKIQFTFPDSIKEFELMKHAQLISSVTSFYYKKPIDFTFSRIHLKNKTITIKRILNNNAFSALDFTIFPVYKGYGIDSLFRKLKQNPFSEKSISLISTLIEKFWQSQFVDPRSSVLLKFAIIEICKGGLKEQTEDYVLNDTINKKLLLKDVKKTFVDAIANIADKKNFGDKWNSYLSPKMLIKSMKSPFEEFLKNKGMDPNTFAIPFSEIKKVRDSITHGSTEKYSLDELDNVNAMLYRICIWLILYEFVDSNVEILVDMKIK